MAGPGALILMGGYLMFFVLYHFNEYKKKKTIEIGNDLFKNGASSKVFLYLMLLTAHFIKLDKKVSKKEEEFVHSNLNNNLPPEIAKLGYEIIEKAYKHDISALIEALNRRAKTVLSYSTKLNILHYLRKLCVVDKVFSEEKALKSLSATLGVSTLDYDKITNLSFSNNLKPENILMEHRMLSEKELKIEEYLIFNKFLGEPDEPDTLLPTSISEDDSSTPFPSIEYANTFNQKGVGKISSSEELTKKINNIEKEIREKTFDERIDEFQDKRIKQQINILDKKLHLFLDILSQKMDPAELTYNKYKQSFERVYMMALENIKDVVSSQRIIESIDKEELQEELERLKKQGRKQHVKTRQERLRLFEEETNRLNEILLNNERAIQEMEEVTFEIGRLKGTKGEDQRAINEAIQDLDEWTDKVKLYDKR